MLGSGSGGVGLHPVSPLFVKLSFMCCVCVREVCVCLLCTTETMCAMCMRVRENEIESLINRIMR